MSRRNGDRSGIALAGLGLACLAADAGDWHRATLTALRRPPRPVRAPWELTTGDAHVGQEQLDRAYATGMALSPDEARDLASGKAFPA